MEEDVGDEAPQVHSIRQSQTEAAAEFDEVSKDVPEQVRDSVEIAAKEVPEEEASRGVPLHSSPHAIRLAHQNTRNSP